MRAGAHGRFLEKEGNNGRFRLEGEERQWFVGQKDSSASTLICVTGVVDLPGGMGEAKVV